MPHVFLRAKIEWCLRVLVPRFARSLAASRWAACATRPRCAGTGAPTWAPCPAAWSTACGAPASTTPSCCSTSWISWARTRSEATPRPRCSRCEARLTRDASSALHGTNRELERAGKLCLLDSAQCGCGRRPRRPATPLPAIGDAPRGAAARLVKAPAQSVAVCAQVLDPEQNSHFTDAYLGLPCDLSKVTFVATANRASDIPGPLLDRLEVRAHIRRGSARATHSAGASLAASVASLAGAVDDLSSRGSRKRDCASTRCAAPLHRLLPRRR